MRYFVLSDVHSNIEALDATIQRAKQAGYDAVLCCGDLVGYGPNPIETIDRIRKLNPIVIRGNHDRVAANSETASEFNPNARRAIFWTRSVLPESYRNYLAGLPMGPLRVGESAQLIHGAITDEDEYILTDSDALENLDIAQSRLTFFGHTHIPCAFAADSAGEPIELASYEFDEFTAVRCDGEAKLIINPGSVGQPRDGDNRASFLIWDDHRNRLEFYRAEYPVAQTQAKMAAAHLPEYLIERLSRGR